MNKIRRAWWLLLAKFHLSDAAVCEMSKGLGSSDFHRIQDADTPPTRVYVETCKRCGKGFKL